MDRMIAFCGLVCSDCPGFVATQANDLATLDQLAEHARNEYGIANASVETVKCDGCLSTSRRKCSYCAECDIRRCGVERGVENCAYCSDYVCEKLARFFTQVPAARSVLDPIHAAM